jgi:lysophospholipase L1-like esterase
MKKLSLIFTVVIGLLMPLNTEAQTTAYLQMQIKALTQDWANIKRYEDANSNLIASSSSKKKVVFIGDSITDFWIMRDSSFFKSNSYIERGISGQTTGQMLVRFREDVINLKPSVVVILAGTNDIAENNGPSKLDDVAGNIYSMVQLAKVNHIKVVLCSVLPVTKYLWRPTINPIEKVKALNEMLSSYAEKNHLIYVDYYTALVDKDGSFTAALAFDGVHPNLQGYKVMEPLVQIAVNKAL